MWIKSNRLLILGPFLGFDAYCLLVYQRIRRNQTECMMVTIHKITDKNSNKTNEENAERASRGQHGFDTDIRATI